MKVLTWNCNMNFRNDFFSVHQSGCDVIFVQECERLPRDNFEGFDFHWVGHNEKKGLGILTRGPSKFPQDLYRSDLIYFLPVAFQEVLILGVWAYNSRAQKFGADFSGYFLDALDHYAEWMKSAKKVFIAGDFNNGPQWDVPGHPNNFVSINDALNELGLRSAYHDFKLEQFGNETQATYFHQRNPEKQFHIDYIYTNYATVRSVDVGSFVEWSKFSDHVPLSAAFDPEVT